MHTTMSLSGVTRAFDRAYRRKITAEQELEIRYRRMDGEKVKALALEYGITASHIKNNLSPLERP